MGEFVIRLAAFALERHVIGPDVGTGASLFAAALYPGRLLSLVVGGGGAAFPLRLGGVLKECHDPDPTTASVRPHHATGFPNPQSGAATAVASITR
jgi:hypothetical protein